MKKVVKIISFILVIIIFAALLISKIEWKKNAVMSFPQVLNNDGCLALNYHRVRNDKLTTKAIEVLTRSDELQFYSIYEDEFEYQMKTLKENGAYFATVEEIMIFQEKGEFPDKCIWISFDDVDETVYNNAFPILKKYDIPFTLFLIASHVGNENFNNMKMTTWEQIQEMVDSGLASVGSHTYDMHYLIEDEPVFFDVAVHDDFAEDLVLSKNTIETSLKNVEVLDFAYPFGNGSTELANIIRECGFRTSFILAPRIIDEGNDSYWLNRILVDGVVFEDIVLPWIKSN